MCNHWLHGSRNDDRHALLPRSHAGSARHPRLGARVRGGRRAPRRRRVGRARGDAVAQKIGLYGFEALAQFWGDESGLTLPIVNEELFWGDAGIGMAIMGTSLAVAGIFSSGTPEQMGEWIPQCFGTPEEPKVAAFCVSEPDAGSDVSSLRTRAVYDEAADEWLLNGQKAWATNGGIAGVHVVVASVDRELGSRGQAGFIIPPATKGLEMGTKVQKHGLRASHTADVFLDDCRVPGSCLLGGKEKLDERLARAREGRSGKRQAA